MPGPHLATERLLLRPAEPADADALHAMWRLPEVRRYLWDDELVGRDVVAEVIARSGRDFDADGFGLWVVQLRADDAVVGFCGFRHEPGTGDVELVYGIHPDHWGRGLATEAARGALCHAFETLALEEVVAGSDVPNAASLRVLEKLGMTERHRFRQPGQPHEQASFALAAADYRSGGTAR